MRFFHQSTDFGRDRPPQTSSCAPRILLVDTDDATVRLVQDTLLGEGYDVTVARNGRDALACVRANHFQLLITDLHVTGLNGLELIETAASLRPKPEIVVLTASCGRGAFDNVVRLGVQWILFKPHREPDLLAVTRRVLGEPGG